MVARDPAVKCALARSAPAAGTPAFRDHFARQAACYAHARPDYPTELFDALAGAVPGRALAWDCGTGSGQAAVPLAARFARVVATDASAAQLAHARRTGGVHYVASRAELCPLGDRTADLVTVAQALHWFDLPAFYAEVRRVLRPGGVVAAWTYGDARLAHPEADARLCAFDREIVGRYWPPERAHVRDGYRGLPFPFAPVQLRVPPAITREWGADELLAYLTTWSATVRCAEQTGRDPLDAFGAALRRALAGGTTTVRWPLVLLAGRV